MNNNSYELLSDVFGKRYIDETDEEIVSSKQMILTLKPILHLSDIRSGAGSSQPLSAQIELRLCAEAYPKGYIVTNLKNFILQLLSGDEVKMGKKLVFNLDNSVFAEGSSKALWDMIWQTLMDELSLENQVKYTSVYGYNRYGYGHSYGEDEKTAFYSKYFKLSPTNLDRFIQLMGDEKFDYVYYDDESIRTANKNFGSARAVKGEVPVTLKVKPGKKNTKIKLVAEMMIIFGRGSKYVICDGGLYQIKPSQGIMLSEMQYIFDNKEKELSLPNIQVHDFISKLMPRIEKVVKVEMLGDLEDRYERLPLETDIYIDYYEHGLALRIVFKYGFYEFNPYISNGPDGFSGEKILVRDVDGEAKIIQMLSNHYFFLGENEWQGWLLQPDEEQAYDFLQDLPALDKLANVNCVNLKDFTASAQSISVGVRINDKSVLELSTAGKKYDFAELMSIFNSYRNKSRYHRLKDGRFMPLGNQQLEKLAGMLELVNKKQLKGDTIELPLSRLMYVDSLGRGDDAIKLERDKRFKNVVKAIRNPDMQEMDIPDSLQDVLREYQVTGVNWLNSLSKLSLGGILADDMGLGKTLQVIAFIQSKKQEALQEMEPALVIAPTSLIFNWLEEIKKFAPDLKAMAIAGTKTDRETLLQDISSQDIVITTYNMLVKDLDIYSEKYFSYCFIDEAQHIKNPTTQKAHAVKEIKAGGYFALTGTPIENTLTELWSIFDFVMPGYLYGHEKFKKRFETPIVRTNDEKASDDLYRHISPFILRRLKKDVLTELPDKLERRMLNEMTEKQSKVYDAYFVQAKKELAEELQQNGFEKSRIKILAMLTRLRQIACDPAIFLEDYMGGSGKLDMLEEMVEEAVSSGHRILIFSQFTQMLQRIAQRLGQMKVNYYYLDGATKAQERIRLVKNFNDNTENTAVFLLSLKAGGTGLNLTGADMVINYDPWWNPAVEDQAADRAYRIGQQRNVQVIKMITKDTIEEQIYELQEKKKALIDKMLQPGESFLSKLSEEEIKNLFM